MGFFPSGMYSVLRTIFGAPSSPVVSLHTSPISTRI